MDVVPVYREHWTYAPFGAEIDDEGRIFARGTQDMKSVGMQYLRAIKALKDQGVQLKRTVHVMYVPGTLFIEDVNKIFQFEFDLRIHSQTKRLVVTRARVHLFKLTHSND